jgi:hypothetical protein
MEVVDCKEELLEILGSEVEDNFLEVEVDNSILVVVVDNLNLVEEDS